MALQFLVLVITGDITEYLIIVGVHSAVGNSIGKQNISHIIIIYTALYSTHSMTCEHTHL